MHSFLLHELIVHWNFEKWGIIPMNMLYAGSENTGRTDIKGKFVNMLPKLRLWPYHPEHAWSHLISEAKQSRAWLALGWEDIELECDNIVTQGTLGAPEMDILGSAGLGLNGAHLGIYSLHEFPHSSVRQNQVIISPLYRFALNITYWVGQKVPLGFSLPSYGKPEWTFQPTRYL